MKKFLASFVLAAGLAAMPAGASAASVCAQGQPAGVAPLYCIPSSPAAAAQASANSAAGSLSKLTPLALAGKGGVKLSGTASGPGTLKIVLTAKIHGRTVVIGTGLSTISSAGKTTVKLVLTKAGKRALKGVKGKLRATVTATFTPQGGQPTTASSKVGLK